MVYTWNIISFKVKDIAVGDKEDYAVTIAEWKCTATDENGITADYIGKTKLGDVTNFDNFISFNSITEEVAISWVCDTIPESEMDIIKHILNEKIANKKSKTIQPPWWK